MVMIVRRWPIFPFELLLKDTFFLMALVAVKSVSDLHSLSLLVAF